MGTPNFGTPPIAVLQKRQLELPEAKNDNARAAGEGEKQVSRQTGRVKPGE